MLILCQRFFLEEMPKHLPQIFTQGQYKYPLESWLQGSKGYAVEDPGLRDLAANLVGTNSGLQPSWDGGGFHGF